MTTYWISAPLIMTYWQIFFDSLFCTPLIYSQTAVSLIKLDFFSGYMVGMFDLALAKYMFCVVGRQFDVLFPVWIGYERKQSNVPLLPGSKSSNMWAYFVVQEKRNF